jgi:translocation and assembly module TamB
VKGQLTVREQPGSETRAAGQLQVAGTYRAYGQDLTIQRGNVLYADAPLGNPQLDITAIRKVEDVTAGIRVAGAAQDPQISLFSDPAMGEANALSYLVAGKPLDAIGTSEGEGSALQSAARSLGTAGGGLLAKKLGARLGVDQVGIQKNELTGGSAFTVGQYLSPRLFLSYGVGLFEPGDIVTLRYRLSDKFVVQTQRGSEDTRTGVEYRTER